MEMASSKANFQHKKFNKINWNYWGKPSFIDYPSKPVPKVLPKTTHISVSIPQNSSDISKPYLYKGIDVSGYQTHIDYSEVKRAGAILPFSRLSVRI